MGANDVARVVGRTTDQIAEERIARLNEALAARERERPVMSAISAHEDARRARTRDLARAFVEREKNRDHEITPMEAIIEDNENLGNRRTAGVLKLLQLGEAAAGGLTAKPIAPHKVIPGGLPIYYAVHGSDTGHALTTARTGELQNPAFAVRSTVGASLATAPDGPMGGSGVTFVGKKQTITPGTDRRVVYSDHDFHSTGRSEFLSTIKEYYRQQTGRELTKAEFQKAAKDRSPLLNDIIDAAYQTMHEADVSRAQRRGNYATTSRQAEGFRTELDAGIEKVLSSEQNSKFRSSLANDYNEAKINESIPLSDLAVLIDTQRSFPNYERLVQMGLSPKRPVYPQEVVDAMRQSGAQVIEYDGTTPRGFLDALNEANAFFVDGPQQDAKGGDTRADAKGGAAAETFDTPIPEELRARYDAWYAQLPKNLQYTGDYDLQGAWLERLGRPDRYETTQNGHLDDYGKKPNHITFSTGSKWHDPKVPERAGGEWKRAEDGSWDFYPGTGNKASDDELKAYFDRYEKGNRVHRREVRQDAKGGDGGDSVLSALRRRVGETGEVLDFFGNHAERALARVADTGVPMLNSGAKLLKPAIVGARAALANVTSGGGRYYQPEVRDETNFSKDELESMAMNLMEHGWKGATRYGYTGGPATRWANSQSVGGASVRDGAVTDVFDVDSKDPYGVLSGLHETAESHAMRGNVGKATAVGTLANLAGMGHRALGAIFGDENTPDQGKVRTRIPLDKLPVNPRTTGTPQEWADAARGLKEFGEYMDSLPSARISTRQDAKGGDAPGPETEVSEPPVSEPATQDRGGPRIVINPTTFKNKKDALCVAFNEGFRLWMEANDFQPRSEPTDRQRRFFSDTAYADDELQLRRTILARVATFDTSVKDPTDDQLTETAQFLDGVLESGWCKNEWEQDSVSRLSQAVKAAIGAEPVEPREEPLEPAQAEPLEPVGGEEVQALQAGGSTDDDDEKDKLALQNSGQSDRVDQVEEANLAEREAEQVESAGMQPEAQEQAQEPAGDQGAATAREPAADAPQAGKTASPDDEPTEEQARQADEQNKKNLVAATAEYEKLVGQDKPGSAKPMAEAEQPSRPKLTLRPPVEAGAPGSISFNGVRSRRPGQDDGVGGGIENPIVGSDSPGSISFNGIRRRRPVRGEDEDDGDEFGGGIENPVVSPDSPGSISGPVLSYAPGSIESPVDDPRRREERRKRRDRRRRGLL